MNKKVLILGSKGMLGYALAKVFNNYELTLWDFDEIDITDAQQVEDKILHLNPDIIINAAAYTNVDDCESNIDLAMKVNGIAVGYIAKIAKQIDAVLVHYSTDYIFDGKNKTGYAEDAKSSPVNAYGKTKLRGEGELANNTDKYY